jgi:hypothetical protein
MSASAWQLEFARLVAFPAEPPSLSQPWWQELTSEQPDDFVSTRKKHAREDRGTIEGGILSLEVDLAHVVWLVQPSGKLEEAADASLPTIGPFRDKIAWFVELVSPWLAKSCPPLVRLAFMAKLLQRAAGPQDAYRILGAPLHLPDEIFAPAPNDFALQINRRRHSTVVSGLEVNRLSTWSKFALAVSVETGPTASLRWSDSCYAALELDVNTAPERAELLPQQFLPRLFRELASLGVEIAERGDVP